jgi:hypothetical protein
MKVSFAKVRITNPANADQANHDKMVALFDVETLRRMEADLAARRLKFAQSPENRWAAARLEAIRRRLNLKEPL